MQHDVLYSTVRVYFRLEENDTVLIDLLAPNLLTLVFKLLCANKYEGTKDSRYT
jgi:hypothetical protein